MIGRGLLVLIVSISLVGCRAGQLGHDQGTMRDTLLRLYEHQVVDNLIRTKLKYPVVQIDYSNLTGSLSQAASGSVGGSETNTRNTPVVGAAGALLRKVATSIFNYSVGASQTAQLTMTGQPVIATDSVYKAYVAAIQNDEDLVKPAPKAGPLPPYHLRHRFNDELWYVPAEKSAAFFKVYLDTTVLRQTKVPIELDLKTTILFADKVEKVPSTTDEYTLELVLKDKIPSDSGEVVVPVNGVSRRYRYQPVVDKETRQLRVPRGQLTDRVAMHYKEDRKPERDEVPIPVADFVKAIAGKEAIFRNDNYVAGYVPPVRDQLEEIRSQQELQRLQQLGR